MPTSKTLTGFISKTASFLAVLGGPAIGGLGCAFGEWCERHWSNERRVDVMQAEEATRLQGLRAHAQPARLSPRSAAPLRAEPLP